MLDLSSHHIDKAKLLETVDWPATAPGLCEGWLQSLQLAVAVVLSSDLPIAVRWEPNFVMIYNDAHRRI